MKVVKRTAATTLWKTQLDLEVLRFAWQLSRLLSLNHRFALRHYLIGFLGSTFIVEQPESHWSNVES